METGKNEAQKTWLKDVTTERKELWLRSVSMADRWSEVVRGGDSKPSLCIERGAAVRQSGELQRRNRGGRVGRQTVSQIDSRQQAIVGVARCVPSGYERSKHRGRSAAMLVGGAQGRVNEWAGANQRPHLCASRVCPKASDLDPNSAAHPHFSRDRMA